MGGGSRFLKLISFLFHFDLPSISVRFQIDVTSFGFTSSSLRIHFGLTSISLRLQIDLALALTSSSLRCRSDFPSISVQSYLVSFEEEIPRKHTGKPKAARAFGKVGASGISDTNETFEILRNSKGGLLRSIRSHRNSFHSIRQQWHGTALQITRTTHSGTIGISPFDPPPQLTIYVSSHPQNAQPCRGMDFMGN